MPAADSKKLAAIKARLSIPAFAAPMFLISGPDLVIEACKAGVIGAFPTLNARPIDVLEQWFKLAADLIELLPWCEAIFTECLYAGMQL